MAGYDPVIAALHCASMAAREAPNDEACQIAGKAFLALARESKMPIGDHRYGDPIRQERSGGARRCRSRRRTN